MTYNTAQNGFALPYWHDHVSMPQLSQEALPESVDCAIVGAGFTGLCVALHLLQAERSVVLLDAMPLGQGASGKNGGMVGPSLHKLGLDGLKNIYGEDQAYAILQEGMHAINYFQQFISAQSLDCDLHMTGRFTGVHNQQQLDELALKCEQFERLDGFKYKLIEPHQVHQEIGSEHYYGGMVYHQDGGLHPYKLVTQLAQKVMQLGGQIFDQTEVLALSTSADKHRLHSSKGQITAKQLVIATNGYSKRFELANQPHFKRRVIPLTSAMIATEELPPATINELFPKARMHGGNHRLVQYYRPSPDGKRVLFGARGIDFWDRPSHNSANLKKLMTNIFPQLGDTKIDYSWCGKVAYTFDHGPHIGQLTSNQENIYYAMGYCGSGVARSTYLASRLAKQILGETDFHTAFHDLPFNSRPFYNGKPWFMPLVLKWHGVLDRLGR